MVQSEVELEQSRIYLGSVDSVVFFACGGACKRRCYVTRQTLVMYFGARADTADIAADSLRAYDRAAARINAVAQQLIAEDSCTPCGAVIVTPQAVFRCVTRTASAALRASNCPVCPAPAMAAH
jgi:hypothetical protein